MTLRFSALPRILIPWTLNARVHLSPGLPLGKLCPPCLLLAPSDPVTELAHPGPLTLLSRRGPISPLPAGSLRRRRRRPGGGTCEHRAKEERALSPRLRVAAAPGSPRPRQRSRSAPRARPPPRPAGHVVPPPVAAPEASPSRRLHLRPGRAAWHLRAQHPPVHPPRPTLSAPPFQA